MGLSDNFCRLFLKIEFFFVFVINFTWMSNFVCIYATISAIYTIETLDGIILLQQKIQTLHIFPFLNHDHP